MNFEGQSNQKSQEEWFEGKFNEREKIDILGGQVEVLDIKPDELKNETPVLLVSGYGDGSPIGRKSNVSELVKHGRRTMMIKAPHGVEHEIKDEKAKDMQDTFLRQIAAIVPTLDKKGIEKINAIGESEGGAIAIMMAYLYPERFEQIVLVDPAGMIGEDNWFQLAKRFVLEGMQEGRKVMQRKKEGDLSPSAQEQLKKGTGLFLKYILSSPKKAINEIDDMTKAQIYNYLLEIKKSGIGISIIHGIDDKVFPMEKVQENLKRQTPEEELKIDGFYAVKGGHGSFNTNPEKYTRAAEEALSALEAKKRKYTSV